MKPLGRPLGRWIFFATFGAVLAHGTAQAQPTQAQISAVRSSCRSDFMAQCSGVSPGGQAALACLQQNAAKLSSACKSAVSATMPAPAAAAPAPSPAAAPAATSAATPPPAAPPAAPVAAAPAKVPAATAKVTPAPAKAPPPTKAPATAAKAAPAPAQQRTAVVAPPPPPPVVYAPPPAMPLRQEAMIIRTACGFDYRRLCGGVPVGGGRVIACLRANAPALSPTCRRTLAGAFGG